MTQVVVLHKFPGAKPGQILELDERTRKAVKAGNARILPGEGSEPEPAPPAPEVGRMRGTGNSLSLVDNDYDELTAPGEKGPEGLTDAELEELTAPSEDD